MNDPISTPQVPPIPLVPAEMLHALTVAHAEIARLRLAIRRLAEQDATLSLLCKRDGSQVVTVTMDATLTDAEREALEWLTAGESPFADEESRLRVLRGLLERLG